MCVCVCVVFIQTHIHASLTSPDVEGAGEGLAKFVIGGDIADGGPSGSMEYSGVEISEINGQSEISAATSGLYISLCAFCFQFWVIFELHQLYEMNTRKKQNIDS